MNEQTHEMGSASSWMDGKILVTPRCSCGWFGFRVVADADKSDDAHFKAGMQWNQHMDTVREKQSTSAAQTFYVIKRDEEPRCLNPGFGWQEKPMLTTSAGEHNRWKRDLDLMALLPDNPTARIVKVRVEEIEG
jgi:hypothetical protein